MPRKRQFPVYPQAPHSSNQARIRVGAKHVYLGKFGSPESYAAYGRLHSDWKAGCLRPGVAGGAGRRVRDVFALWMIHAEERYRGSRELNAYRDLGKPLCRLYGDVDAVDFGPRALKVLQEAMSTGNWRTPEELVALKKKGRDGRWGRKQVNLMTTRCKTLFRWAESEELIPGGAYQALRTVSGLRPGQHGVREASPVPPVTEEILAKTLPCLNPAAAAIVELLALTGARPGELLGLRPCDVNQTGDVEIARGLRIALGAIWCVQPKAHKTAHRGHARVILFGPRAQAILRRLPPRRDDEPYFQPVEGEAMRRSALRARRKSKVQPSQVNRKKVAPKKAAGKLYNPSALGQAVRGACKRAGVPHWFPYMLRHLAATRLASEFGPEVARIVLGHRDLSITRVYVVDDLKKAAAAMGKAG